MQNRIIENNDGNNGKSLPPRPTRSSSFVCVAPSTLYDMVEYILDTRDDPFFPLPFSQTLRRFLGTKNEGVAIMSGAPCMFVREMR